MPTASRTQGTANEIVDRVIHAILAGRLKPGTRSGEALREALSPVPISPAPDAAAKVAAHQARAATRVSKSSNH